MECLVCSCECKSFRYEYADLDCYHCPSCELIFKDPKCHETFDKQKQRYDLHENSAENKGYRAYFQKFLDFVLPQIKDTHKALDFGCGESSLLADMLGEIGIDCNYYDPIYHPNDKFQEYRYDLVTSVEVFEHLHDPMAVISELLSILNEDGFIAIRTEFHYNSIERFVDWHYPRDPTHIMFFTPKTFGVIASLYNLKYIGDNGKNMLLLQK